MAVWNKDPWNERSEEFYTLCYKGGVCRYCGKEILTKLDICGCAGMLAARARFKALISGTPAAKAELINYNPDQFTEQEDVF
jgi:hypothetical protein